jgi:putative ABC transport system permease protein
MHLSKIYLAENGLKDASDPLYAYMLSGISLFILLIASINFVNLTIARSIRRAREIGIRKVAGGSRRQLMIQFLGESYLLCITASVLSIILVQWAMPIFNQLSHKALSISYLLNARIILGYSSLFLLTGLLAGIYPAFVLSGYKPIEALQRNLDLRYKVQFQKALVVFQFGLAAFFVVATLTIYAQFDYLTNKDLGYDDSHVVVVEQAGMSPAVSKLVKSELQTQPGIADIAFKNSGGETTAAWVNGETEIEFQYETIDGAYLSVLGVSLISGRNFSAEFPSDTLNSVLVNETFVKTAGWKEPIGQTVNFWHRNNERYTVVGVVKDYHYLPLNRKINPQIFTMNPRKSYGLALVKIHPESQAKSLAAIENTFKKIFPDSPFIYSFKDVENQRQYETEVRWKRIVLIATMFMIFISCMGLFGLSVLSAERRVKEIGIRKVLGASVFSMARLLSFDFLKLVTVSILIAMPLAGWLADFWLSYYPYRISLNWSIFASTAFIVVLISMVTISFQALSTASTNPVDSLRRE